MEYRKENCALCVIIDRIALSHMRRGIKYFFLGVAMLSSDSISEDAAHDLGPGLAVRISFDGTSLIHLRLFD